MILNLMGGWEFSGRPKNRGKAPGRGSRERVADLYCRYAGVIPLLSAAGVSAISVGANGGSAAPLLPGYNLSRLSQLPTPFVWRDKASSTSVIAHWHPGGYVPKLLYILLLLRFQFCSH